MRLNNPVAMFPQKGKTAGRKQIQRWTIVCVATLFLVAFVAIEWQGPSPIQGLNVTFGQGNQGNHGDQGDGGGHSGVRQICEDSCQFARNGICEDGSDAGESAVKVFCDLGTDCSDCGPWITEAERVVALPKDNIKALVDKRRDLFVRSTVTDPPFLMPYTDYKVDVDVSRQMHLYRAVEGGLTALWKEPLERCCNADPSHPGLVLDVGGNFGWYALYAAKLGCRVITWEPIPHYREYLHYGVVANNLTSLIEIRGRVVSSAGNEIFEMLAPDTGNWGIASINGQNIIKEDRVGLKKILVTGERLDDVVAEDVCILKVDVEGFEADVFDSAKELFKNHVVHNVFIEYSPGVWENTNYTELFRLSDVLSDLLDGGYNIRNIPDRISKFTGSDEILPLVTREQIALDVQDLEHLVDGNMGCSKMSEEMKNKYTGEGICNRIPFSTHPKSFRSEFIYNTNVWAIKQEEDFMPKDSVVGVLKPEEPLSQYFTTTGYGIGGLECAVLPPGHPLPARIRYEAELKFSSGKRF